MEQIIFTTVKVAIQIDLEKIAAFFKLQNPTRWKEYVRIDHSRLEEILKYPSQYKRVFIFKFGCVSFVNFDQNEIYTFLEYLDSLIGNVDYSMSPKLNESHRLELLDDGTCSLWVNGDERVPYHAYIVDVTAIVLAKSTELYKIEMELTQLLDESEKFILYLQRGRLRANFKKISGILAKIIRFKYQGLRSIKLFDRPFEADKTILSRQVYDQMAQYYELEERYSVIKNQMDHLQSITQSYSKLGYNQTESRLLWLEVFLLALFPVFHALNHIVGVEKMLDAFIRLK